MGIKGLSNLIADNAPRAIKHTEMKNLFGRKVAVDASMSIYQFLVAVRSEGNVLQNEQGETTSHIMGMFYRTVRMVENGLKPCYVFDGKPPTLKSGELAKRTERRAEAEKSLEAAKEKGDAENVEKFSRRLVKATKKHSEDCKELLKLMGIPYYDAPCEAEAQCAELVRAGSVYAAGTEDMDALTFGTKVLLRHLTFSEARKMPIQEFHLQYVLEDLDFTMDQFIDLCILLGCDYCETIRGVGPHRALTLIREHKSIEIFLEILDSKRYKVPEDWNYKGARQLFLEPEIDACDDVALKWEKPNIEELVNFMCVKHGFAEERIRKTAAKLMKNAGKATQGRMYSFFQVLPSKRKASVPARGSKKVKGKASGKKGGAGRPRK